MGPSVLVLCIFLKGSEREACKEKSTALGVSFSNIYTHFRVRVYKVLDKRETGKPGDLGR